MTEVKPEKLIIVPEKDWENLNNQLKELQVLTLSHHPATPPPSSPPILKIIIEDPLSSDSLHSSKELIKELTKELITSSYN